jgi:putative ABC transport system ATP-binding protein
MNVISNSEDGQIRVKEVLIDVSDLSKIYGLDGKNKNKNNQNNQIIALDKLSFKLFKGQSLAILGPSGSGKTTLLELLAGLTNSTSGTVLIDGTDVFKGSDNDLSTFRNKTIGFVFQLMHLQDYFTAGQNVSMPMIASGASIAMQESRANELLEIVGLANRAGQYPNQLSGGEMQRVAIARALSNNPKLILADEPTAKLDKANTDIVMSIFKKIQARGVSIILITHDPEIANQFENRIELQHGKVKNIYIKNN